MSSPASTPSSPCSGSCHILLNREVYNCGEAFFENPRPGEVYNVGGGRQNSVSVLEALSSIEELCGRRIDWCYDDQHRVGDHICYISNLAKLRSHFPGWNVTVSLPQIVEEMVTASRHRTPVAV